MATTQNFMSPHVVISDEVAAYKPPYGGREQTQRIHASLMKITSCRTMSIDARDLMS